MFFIGLILGLIIGITCTLGVIFYYTLKRGGENT